MNERDLLDNTFKKREQQDPGDARVDSLERELEMKKEL